MLDEIKSFFDQLRMPFEWPDHFPEIDVVSGVNLRALCEKHHRLAMLALDKSEFHLLELYRAGTDSGDAIEFLDQVIAIIRRDGSADERMCALGFFLRRQQPRVWAARAAAVAADMRYPQSAIGTA